MEEIFVPLGLFAIIPVIIWTIQHYRQKAKDRSTEVIQSMIAKDVEITPALIKSVGFQAKRAHGDLRTSMILIAIGVAMISFGRAIPDDDGEAQAIFAGLSSFPILIGLALLAFWFMVSRKEQN